MPKYDLKYYRTDRNGTKYYYDINCHRCCGYGELDQWKLTGRICFKCGGSGKRNNPKIVKEYTPEYKAKLMKRAEDRILHPTESQARRDAERQAKQKILEEQARQRTIRGEGFNEEGVAYVYTGNTFEYRDLFRSKGGKWNFAGRCWVLPCLIDVGVGSTYTPITAAEWCNSVGYLDDDKMFLAFNSNANR